jgi:hypothetical protein
MSCPIFSTFYIILLVLGCPEHSSSSTDTQPALKHECYSGTTVRLNECTPKASQNISRVLVTDLPSVTLQTRCPILPFIADKTKYEALV